MHAHVVDARVLHVGHEVLALLGRPVRRVQLLLRRDAESLSTSFRKHGVQVSGEQTLREVQRRVLGPGPEPRVLLP